MADGLKIMYSCLRGTKLEVYEVVMRELGNGHTITLEAVVSVRKTRGGMQTAAGYQRRQLRGFSRSRRCG